MTNEEREYHRQWRARNREKVHEAQRRYYETHTEQRKENSRKWREKNRAREMARNRAFYHANKQKRRAYLDANRERHNEHARRARAKNPQWAKAYARRYRAEKPHILKALSNKRRARKTAAGGAFTAGEWRMLCELYDHTCLACGKREPDIKLVADHVIPVSKGGDSYITNIQPLCFSCNSRKHDRFIDYRTKSMPVQRGLWDLPDDGHSIIG